jgi:putative Holliday junction resolvase
MTLATSRSITSGSPAAMSDSETRRILAIDYGRKRMGLALSDELQMTAQPLLVLARTNRRNDLRRLQEICRKHGVARILVGHPMHITGEAGEMADEAAQFAARLQKELGIEVKLADERLTTWEAEQIVARRKSHNRRKKPSVDDVAAAVLLREYLDRNRAHAEHVAAERE